MEMISLTGFTGLTCGFYSIYAWETERGLHVNLVKGVNEIKGVILSTE